MASRRQSDDAVLVRRGRGSSGRGPASAWSWTGGEGGRIHGRVPGIRPLSGKEAAWRWRSDGGDVRQGRRGLARGGRCVPI